MRLFITGLLLLAVNLTYAQIPTYYNDVDVTLTGTALKNALTTKITATHTNFLSYTPGVWEASMVTDVDPSNSSNVLLIYGYSDIDGNYITDRSRSKTANGGSAGTDWNREHSFPKSLGDPNLGTSGPGADAHHLRPSDVTMNSNRGSLKFIDGSGNAGTTGSGWYPGDEWKGDVARMMLYMYLRYGTRCLPSNVAIGTTNSVDSNMIDLLLEWNSEDPVSDFERQRNTYHEDTSNTYAQGNRNPFIDNPAFATSIWGGPAAEDFFSASASGCTELFISEYIEGSSNNKYIELYNPTNASINLSTYDIVIYTNGSSSVSNTLALSGTITAYGTFVIENNSEALGVTADLSTNSAVMSFNGDDVIALRKSSTNIDIIGQIGTDPGSQWVGSVCTVGTADGVLRRNENVNKGDSEGSDTFDPDSEWTCAAADDVSNLGIYGNNCAPNPEIDVQGNGSSIADGSTTTQLSDFTDFGSVAASSGTIIRTFTIANTGTSTLTISSNPSISGTGAGDFTVTSNPSLSISSSGSTTFQITFDPSAEATSTATVTINSDDSDEAVYTFDISGIGTAGSGSSCGNELFISEYIEGSSNNKYIEIYNPTEASVDLSSYDLVKYTNGSSTVSNTLTLSGTIAAQSTYVIENSSEALGVTADLSTNNAVMDFNGDDVIALRKSSTNLDVIGQIGTDPGTQWVGTTCTVGTADGVLRRNSSISIGDSNGSDVFDPDTEWTCATNDDVSNLGSHSVDCSGGGGSSTPCGDDLFISEYIEGSSNNKYIELYNPTDSSIDLSSYDLVKYTNGSATVSNTLALSGTIASKGTYVIEDSAEALGVTADLSTNSAMMDFNGDDVVALRKSSVNIDVIGQIGVDPGSQWTGAVCTVGTANGVLRRNASISTGDSDGSNVFDPDDEWTCAANDDVSDLGSHTVNCGSGGSSSCSELFISEYIEGSGNNKYIEIYNPSDSSIDLSSYDLVSYTNGSASVSNTLTLSGTIAANGTYVIENTLEALGVTADLSTSNGVMSFNGDDAIALRKSSVAIDVIGQIGTDPGSEWSGTTCTLGTADAVLRRNSSVSTGDSDGSDAFDPDTEWTCSATDDVSDLGSYTSDCNSGTISSCSDLFFSEYIEGTGDNKFLEIYNPSENTIDLSSYDIVRYSNGSSTITNTLTLSGSISPKGTYVIENSAETLSVNADFSTADATMSFNGDDAIALRKSSVAIDVIGQIGTDPGTQWSGTTCTVGTADGTLRRNATVNKGDVDGSDAFDPDTEWTCASTDDVSDLGSYTNNCDSAIGSPEIDVLSNSISIIDGTSTTATVNNTNYGTVNITAGTIVKEYTITNTGTATLTLTGNPSITGSSDFTVTTNPSGLVLDPTNSVTFQITFDPSSASTVSATVEIQSNDSDEASFTFAIDGTGTNSAGSCSIVSGATLYQQDFESSPASPEYTYTSTNTANATGNGNTPSDPKYVSGSQGIQINNATGEIVFSTVDVSESSNVAFSVRLASFSGTAFNGAETSDYVSVFVSTDGGSSYSEELTITGASASNARWSFTSGTGEASTTYDGDNTTTTFAPSGGGDRTTDGYSTIKVTGLPSSSTLRIKLEIKNNSNSELWVLDDAKLIGDSVSSSTWESGSWSNGVPSTTAKTIINDYYDMTANTSINTCECEVMPGATLTIGIDKYLRIENNIINNGTIVIEENGSLIQVSSSATITGSGTYIVRRNSSSVPSDNVFTYWASPLENSTLNEVVSNASLYYSFDGASQTWQSASTATVMTPGVGYITQGPNDGIYPGAYTAVFSGSKFNNGNINVTLGYIADADTDNDWNLLGNPYPSAIDADAFIAANANISGTLYFWSNNTDASSSQNFSQDDYVSWNNTGGIAGCTGCIAPNGAIAAGQGFFVQSLSATDVTFTNDIRDNGNNNNFYRNSNEEDKIWLNFSGANAFSQILVGFLDKATDGEDRLYDGRRLDGGTNATFYSIIDDISFGIQGKSSLKEVEEIPLGVRMNVTGDFKISIEKFEGLLNDSEVYLKDLLLDIEHDLKVSDYEVTLSETGTFDDRFVLKIVTSADVLGLDDLEDNSDLIIVDYENQLEVKTSDNQIIKDVFMYDILGRNLFTKRKSTLTSVYVNGNKINKNAVTLVKVVLESGKVKTMKFYRK